jgi:glycosyltransferase involved in cell wall biosynthesis
MTIRSKRGGILFLLPGIYPCVTAGIELFHYYFVQAIAKHYRVYVATQCERFLPGPEWHVLYHPRRMFNSHTTAVTLHQLKWMARLRREIDLVHVPYSSKAMIQSYHLLPAKHLLGIPYLLRIHGGGMFPSRPFAMHQLLFDQAAAVITVSTPVKIEYEERHGRPIDMIPSMLPFLSAQATQQEIRDKWEIAESDLVILFLGSVKEIKGPDLLLNAFMSLGDGFIRTNRLRLLFAGGGAMQADLAKQAAQSTIADRICFYGTVPHESVCELYKMANIFCIPSLMEARPLALAEALYNGLPTIGSDIPTISNIIKDGESGLLFENRNSRDLSAKLRLLVENDSLRSRLGECAQCNYKGFFDYDKMVDGYCDVYDRVISSK